MKIQIRVGKRVCDIEPSFLDLHRYEIMTNWSPFERFLGNLSNSEHYFNITLKSNWYNVIPFSLMFYRKVFLKKVMNVSFQIQTCNIESSPACMCVFKQYFSFKPSSLMAWASLWAVSITWVTKKLSHYFSIFVLSGKINISTNAIVEYCQKGYWKRTAF